MVEDVERNKWEYSEAGERTRALAEEIRFTSDGINGTVDFSEMSINNISKAKKRLDELAFSSKNQYLVSDISNINKIVGNYISEIFSLYNKAKGLSETGKKIYEYLVERERFYREQAEKAGL